MGQIIYALINPDYVINADLDAPYWELVNTAQKEGSFLEMCKTAIWTGNVANMGWMLLHGRVTQTAGLFMVGMIIGRSNAFLYSEKNIKHLKQGMKALDLGKGAEHELIEEEDE